MSDLPGLSVHISGAPHTLTFFNESGYRGIRDGKRLPDLVPGTSEKVTLT